MASALLAAAGDPGAAIGLTEIIVAAIVTGGGILGAVLARSTRPEAASDTSVQNAAVGDWAEMLEQQRAVNRTLSDELDRLRDELAEERRECDRKIADLEQRFAELQQRLDQAAP